MTSKKKRQRGSRTHGGGSQKNRRGAGGRGGRGDAGRDKHEQHNHEPLGKSGFTRPEAVQRDVRTVDLRTIDEDAPMLVEQDLAERTDDGYRVDARDLVDDEGDAVKVIGGGQVRNALTVVADAFSDGATDRIESAGGTAELSDRASETKDSADETEATDPEPTADDATGA